MPLDQVQGSILVRQRAPSQRANMAPPQFSSCCLVCVLTDDGLRHCGAFSLSVTKWIHLHGGDDAIRRTFARCRDQLVVGGLLFLEPQEWRTYRRKKNLTPQMAVNYEQIAIRPDSFVGLLEKDFSFRLLSSIAPLPAASRGFQRHLHVLRRI